MKLQKLYNFIKISKYRICRTWNQCNLVRLILDFISKISHILQIWNLSVSVLIYFLLEMNFHNREENNLSMLDQLLCNLIIINKLILKPETLEAKIQISQIISLLHILKIMDLNKQILVSFRKFYKKIRCEKFFLE